MKIDLLVGTLKDCSLMRLQNRNFTGLITATIARGHTLDQYVFVLSSPNGGLTGAALSGFVLEMCNQGLSPERIGDIVEQSTRQPYAHFAGLITEQYIAEYINGFLPRENITAPARVLEVLSTTKRNTLRAIVWDGTQWHAEYLPVNTNPNAVSAMVH